MKQPVGGFNDTALNDIFAQTVARYTPMTPSSSSSAAASSSASSPTGTPSPEGGAPTKKSSSHAGAIAGGVVGGIAAIAILGLGTWFWRRRRRVPQQLVQAQQDYQPKYKPELPADQDATGGNGYYAPPGLAHHEPQELSAGDPRAEFPGSQSHIGELP